MLACLKTAIGTFDNLAKILGASSSPNFSPLEIILNILSTISFSDPVDELDDKLDEDEDEEGDLFLFSCLDLDFLFTFLLERFTISWKFLFLFFDLCRLSRLLVEEVSGFSGTLFAGPSYELSPALSSLCPASSLELTTGKITIG